MEKLEQEFFEFDEVTSEQQNDNQLMLYEKELAKVLQRNEILQKQLETKEEEKRKYEDDFYIIKNNLRQFNKECKKLKSNEEKLKIILKRLGIKNQELIHTNKDLESHNKELRVEIDGMKEYLTKIVSSCNEESAISKKTLGLYETEIESLRLENTSVKRDNDALEQRSFEIEKDFSRLRRESEELESITKNQKRLITAQEKEIISYKDEVKYLKKSINEIEVDRNALTGKLEFLRKKTAELEIQAQINTFKIRRTNNKNTMNIESCKEKLNGKVKALFEAVKAELEDVNVIRDVKAVLDQKVTSLLETQVRKPNPNNSQSVCLVPHLKNRLQASSFELENIDLKHSLQVYQEQLKQSEALVLQQSSNFQLLETRLAQANGELSRLKKERTSDLERNLKLCSRKEEADGLEILTLTTNLRSVEDKLHERTNELNRLNRELALERRTKQEELESMSRNAERFFEEIMGEMKNIKRRNESLQKSVNLSRNRKGSRVLEEAQVNKIMELRKRVTQIL
eukprot:snap_masked-scaffold_69-processed-gene-0.10-mRNA-1 protein AED:1.00 eAED:1.00 QI:0/0/0/0/1/1/2/0/513